MNKKVYTILDVKGRSIGPLVLAVSQDDVIRSVRDALRADNMMSRYPADFSLLELGEIDVTTGVMKLSPESPVVVCYLDELVDKES